MFRAVSFYVGWRQIVNLEKPKGELKRSALLEWYFSDKEDTISLGEHIIKELKTEPYKKVELDAEYILRNKVGYVPVHILENSNRFEEDEELDPREVILIEE